ncbi:MAG: eCIS core domain-containing protein [Anaerolineae bacterium]
MSEQPIFNEKHSEKTKTIQRKSTEFQEVPGESEANAVRDTFLQRAGTDQASVASALTDADDNTRALAVNRLQAEHGNNYVQRVVAETHGTPGRLVGLSQPQMVDEVTQRKGSGNPLPDVARQPLQQHLGADLSSVRVHSDGEAAALNRELDAEAFTVGKDIFFAEGRYEPTSSAGQGLIAHELAHVSQQTGLGAQRKATPEDGVQRQVSPKEEEDEENVQRAAADEEEEESNKTP